MRLDIIHNTDKEKLQARTTFLWFKWINRYLQCTVQFAIFHSELFRILYLWNWYERICQSVANIQIYSNIFTEYLIFEYEYKKLGYKYIRINKMWGYEYIRIRTNQVSMKNLIQPFICHTFNWWDLNDLYYSNIR